MTPDRRAGRQTPSATREPAQGMKLAATDVGLRTSLRRTWDLFAWSRGAIWLAALLAPLAIAATPNPDTRTLAAQRVTEDAGAVTDVWASWDSIALLDIARDGYDAFEGAAAFYPLQPGLVAALGRVLFGHYVVAGLLVSLAASALAFALLYRLAAPRLSDLGARRAVLLLAVFPTSLFLLAVYTEALFLALSLGAFVCAERGRFAWAGALAGLAWLTRPLGVALLLPLALIAWRRGHRPRDVAWLGLAPLLFALYPALLWQQLDDPFAFRRAEDVWGRELSWAGPLAGIWDGARAAWAGLLQLTIGSDSNPYWTTVEPARAALLNLEWAAYLCLFAALTVVAWRRFGAPYGLYAAISVAIPLSLPQPTFPLLSLSRFGLVVFPFFLALAALTAGRSRLSTAVVGTSAVLLGLNVARWALDQFVA